MKNLRHVFLIFSGVFLLSCEKEEEKQSIIGFWETSAGNIVQVYGDGARYDALISINSYLQAAIDQGFLTEETLVLQNIVENSNGTWTAETYRFSYTEDSEDGIVVTHGEFVEVTITLSEDGKTLYADGVYPDSFPTFLVGQAFDFEWTKDDM